MPCCFDKAFFGHIVAGYNTGVYVLIVDCILRYLALLPLPAKFLGMLTVHFLSVLKKLLYNVAKEEYQAGYEGRVSFDGVPHSRDSSFGGAPGHDDSGEDLEREGSLKQVGIKCYSLISWKRAIACRP